MRRLNEATCGFLLSCQENSTPTRSGRRLLLVSGAILVSCVVGGSPALSAEQSPLQADYLRCEYYVDPVGIDVRRPRLSWIVACRLPDARAMRQSAYRILVADTSEALAEHRGNLWDSGRVESDRTAHVEYDGRPLESNATCHWKVCIWDQDGRICEWSEPARWTMGLMMPEEWTAASIGYDAAPHVVPPPIAGRTDTPVCPPPRYLRKSFSLNAPVRRAIAHASACGLYKLYLNGRRVGEYELTPGWTDYDARRYYNSYDVTGLLRAGANAIGAILGDGWFSGHVGGGRRQSGPDGEPRLSVQLHIEYADGTTGRIVTDGSWKAAHGAILESDLQMGETYDARLELGDWAAAGYDDFHWAPAVVMATLDSPIAAYPGSPTRKIEELIPRSVAEPTPGAFVFDLGQNMVGWVRLKVSGEAGTVVQLRFAEVLNPDGTVYTANLRGARCIDRYLLKGEGEEVWEPSFTFHGFRYVEVTGYPGRPPLDAITGVVVHADAPLTSSFECSNPMLNQLHRNTVWGQRGNYLEVPTDCPQRDERLGWTGDAQIFVRTATYNMDVAAFFRKWLVDLEDTQSEDGAYADRAPGEKGGADSPGWTDAAIICPHAVYAVYGDSRIIRRHYGAMKNYLRFVESGCDEFIRPGRGYGDWLSLGTYTSHEVIATAYLARIAALMAEMATAIGETDDADAFRSMHAGVKAAFIREFVDGRGVVDSNTQTAYALAFAFDLLPDESQPAALEHLLRDLQYRSWHLSTGFLGTPLLLPSLTRAGRTDVAYRLLTNDTFPSWGYQVKHGATTMWERWDSWTEEFGFADPAMNSFNHYAYGAVGEWMFANILGIDTDGPGYRKIRVQPRRGGGLTHARGHYDSINGRIATDWRIDDGSFDLSVDIPPNTTASVHIPTVDPSSVTERGRPANASEGVEFVRADGGAAVYRVGSGSYVFKARLAR